MKELKDKQGAACGKSPLKLGNADDLAVHLRSLEEALLDGAVRADRKQVSALLTEDFFEFGQSGIVWTRDRILDLLEAGDYDSPGIERFECHRIQEDVALVTYRTVQAATGSKPPVVTLRSSLWIRESGQWRIRFHQGTAVPKR
jgi:glyoxylase I family protein